MFYAKKIQDLLTNLFGHANKTPSTNCILPWANLKMYLPTSTRSAIKCQVHRPQIINRTKLSLVKNYLVCKLDSKSFVYFTLNFRKSFFWVKKKHVQKLEGLTKNKVENVNIENRAWINIVTAHSCVLNLLDFLLVDNPTRESVQI
jgi:hypothetical protein